MDRRRMNMQSIDCYEDYCNAVAMIQELKEAPDDSEEAEFRNLLETMVAEYQNQGRPKSS